MPRRDPRESLRRRQEQVVRDSQRKSGGKFILNFDDIKPEFYTVHYWNGAKAPKSGERITNHLDFMPYIITQSWYPKLLSPKGQRLNLHPGETDYKLEIPVHSFVGPGNEQVFCRRLGFGEECFRCDQYFEEKDKDVLSPKEITMMKARWINYFNVIDLNGDPNKIVLWTGVSYYNFDAVVANENKTPPAEEGDDFGICCCYADIIDGKSVEFRWSEASLGDNKYYKAEAVTFHDRDEPYNESWIKKAVSLDKYVVFHTPDEVKNKCLGIGIDFEEEEEGKVVSGPGPLVEEESKTEEEYIDTLSQLNRSQLRDIIKNEDLEITIKRGMTDDDIRLAIKNARIAKHENDPPFDPDKSDNECPNKHTFGSDCELFADCVDDCPEETWSKCSELNKKLEQQSTGRKAK